MAISVLTVAVAATRKPRQLPLPFIRPAQPDRPVRRQHGRICGCCERDAKQRQEDRAKHALLRPARKLIACPCCGTPVIDELQGNFLHNATAMALGRKIRGVRHLMPHDSYRIPLHLVLYEGSGGMFRPTGRSESRRW